MAAFSVARRSGSVRMAADGIPTVMPAGGAPGGSGGDSGTQLPPRGGVRRASQPAGGMRRGGGAAVRRTRRRCASDSVLSVVAFRLLCERRLKAGTTVLFSAGPAHTQLLRRRAAHFLLPPAQPTPTAGSTARALASVPLPADSMS